MRRSIQIVLGLLLLLGLAVAAIDRTNLPPHSDLQVALEQVADAGPEARRAVVLVHGLRGGTFLDEQARSTYFPRWQRAGSPLVEALAESADVFSVSYSQNVEVEAIAASPAWEAAVAEVAAGPYDDVVLVGHSAGGLLSRWFVEDHPEAGVTGVVQLCAPNHGSGWARLSQAGRVSHEAFIASLSDEAREPGRGERQLPQDVDFLVVVCDGTGTGDGVVAQDAQWPEDLQRQGIAAVRVPTLHFTAPRGQRMAAQIAAWVEGEHPRLESDELAEVRSRVLGD